MNDHDLEELEELGPETCEWCGQEYEDEEHDFDCPNQLLERSKWVADGASTLNEAIAAFEGYVEYLRKLRDEGWELQQEVDNAYLFLGRRGDGQA